MMKAAPRICVCAAPSSGGQRRFFSLSLSLVSAEEFEVVNLRMDGLVVGWLVDPVVVSLCYLDQIPATFPSSPSVFFQRQV
jgi:hypothetical protein